eukprot:596569-Rhodomonas_salina.1
MEGGGEGASHSFSISASSSLIRATFLLLTVLLLCCSCTTVGCRLCQAPRVNVREGCRGERREGTRGIMRGGGGVVQVHIEFHLGRALASAGRV